jgi:fibronectin-binding autotransporter adhesin
MTTNVLLDGGTINSGGTYTMYATDGITVTANGGTLTNVSGTWTTCNLYSQSNTSITLTGSGSYRPGGAAGTTTGTINLGAGAIIKGGSGDCNMGYANASLEVYSNLVLNGGSLSFNYDASGGTTSLGAVPSTLNPSNIYFNGGSLHVGHSTTIGATRGIYVASGGGTIEDVVSSGGTVTIDSPISGPGSVSFPNGHSAVISAIILAANNTYTGTTTIGVSNAVTVGAGGTTGTLGTGDTTDNWTLTFNLTGSYSYGGVISGSGSVAKTASGTVTLTGANTYSGNTTNSAGTLLINNTSGSGTGTGNVAVNSGSTLGGNGFISGAVTINSGATLAPGPMASSVGTLTINNNLSIAGNVAIAINKSLSPSNSAVVVTGTLANTGSGTLKVSNLGPALAVGDRFQIFSEPLTGNAMTVSGGGAIWNNNLAVDGSISVAAVPIPVITSFSFIAGNLVLAGTNGNPSDGFSVLTSTNVATPLTNWTTFTTGSYNGSGNFAVTNAITKTAPAQFFIIESH